MQLDNRYPEKRESEADERVSKLGSSGNCHQTGITGDL